MVFSIQGCLSSVLPDFELVKRHNELFFGTFNEKMLIQATSKCQRNLLKGAKLKLYKSDLCEIYEMLGYNLTFRPYRGRTSTAFKMMLGEIKAVADKKGPKSAKNNSEFVRNRFDALKKSHVEAATVYESKVKEFCKKKLEDELKTKVAPNPETYKSILCRGTLPEKHERLNFLEACRTEISRMKKAVNDPEISTKTEVHRPLSEGEKCLLASKRYQDPKVRKKFLNMIPKIEATNFNKEKLKSLKESLIEFRTYNIFERLKDLHEEISEEEANPKSRKDNLSASNLSIFSKDSVLKSQSRFMQIVNKSSNKSKIENRKKSKLDRKSKRFAKREMPSVDLNRPTLIVIGSILLEPKLGEFNTKNKIIHKDLRMMDFGYTRSLIKRNTERIQIKPRDVSLSVNIPIVYTQGLVDLSAQIGRIVGNFSPGEIEDIEDWKEIREYYAKMVYNKIK